MDIITQSLAIIVFCLALFGISWVIRKCVEVSLPKILIFGTTINRFWRELILPVMPIVVGALAGLIPSYPYPALFVSTYSHILFGIFCGLICGLVYRLMKQNLLNKLKSATGENKPEDPVATK